jgi:hypothetical protein
MSENSCAVTGIIDWDRARRCDLAIVDTPDRNPTERERNIEAVLGVLGR